MKTSAVPCPKPSFRRFDPSKTMASPEGESIVCQLLQKMNGIEGRRRARRETDRRRMERFVEALAADLLHRHLQAPDEWISLELSKQKLSAKARRAPFLTEQIPDIVRLLAQEAVGAVVMEKGTWSRFGGTPSRLRAGRWLVTAAEEAGLSFQDIGRELELLGDPVILRGDKCRGRAERLTLPEGAEAAEMLREMQEINARLAIADIGWAGCEVEDAVDLGKRHLTRIFNGNLQQGGRLYHGFWIELAREPRMDLLRINGHPVVALDFAQMALHCAYAEVGVAPPEGDLYALPGFGREYREGVKKVVNALLCSSGPLLRMPNETRQYFRRSTPVRDVVTAVAKRHPALVPLLGTARALRFQFLESQVTVRALRALGSRGVTALPVHDSLLVAHPDEELARQALDEAARAVLGVTVPLDVTRSSVRVVPRGSWVGEGEVRPHRKGCSLATVGHGASVSG